MKWYLNFILQSLPPRLESKFHMRHLYSGACCGAYFVPGAVEGKRVNPSLIVTYYPAIRKRRRTSNTEIELFPSIRPVGSTIQYRVGGAVGKGLWLSFCRKHFRPYRWMREYKTPPHATLKHPINSLWATWMIFEFSFSRKSVKKAGWPAGGR